MKRANEVAANVINEVEGRATGTSARAGPKRGVGEAIGHHGEILQGMFEDDRAERVRALVTLPNGNMVSRATFELGGRGTAIEVEPAWKVKSAAAAKLAIRELTGLDFGGRLRVSNSIPPGIGAGSSTSDVAATLRAVSRTVSDADLSANQIALLATEAETACDSTMFCPGTVLFAHRRGLVVEDFLRPLPAMTVLGFDTDPTRQGIDTLGMKMPEYDWRDIQAFRPLRGLLRYGIWNNCIESIGRVATVSSEINQRFLPKQNFERLLELINQLGATGLQVAHSGSIAGLIFDPSDQSTAMRLREGCRYLSELGVDETSVINVGSTDHG